MAQASKPGYEIICPEEGERPTGSISYYWCRGREIQAKLYVPAHLAGQILHGSGRRVRLIYRGEALTTSASRACNGTIGVKIYLPAKIARELWAQGAPNRALIEIHEGAVEVLGAGWSCRICGGLTSSPDRLCWSHRIEGDGMCKRCGADVPEGAGLCDKCLEQFTSITGCEHMLGGGSGAEPPEEGLPASRDAGTCPEHGREWRILPNGCRKLYLRRAPRLAKQGAVGE